MFLLFSLEVGGHWEYIDLYYAVYQLLYVTLFSLLNNSSADLTALYAVQKHGNITSWHF
jgi:hypothetical protein